MGKLGFLALLLALSIPSIAIANHLAQKQYPTFRSDKLGRRYSYGLRVKIYFVSIMAGSLFLFMIIGNMLGYDIR